MTLDAWLGAWKTRLDRAAALFGRHTGAGTAWGAMKPEARWQACGLCGALEVLHAPVLRGCPVAQPWEREGREPA